MFLIGQRVRCINGNWGAATGTPLQRQICPNLPVIGEVYTIRRTMRLTATYVDGPCWFVQLFEVVNPLNRHGDEPIFHAKNFVPLSDISFAHEIARDPSRPIKRSKEEVEYFRLKKGKRRERA